MQPLRSAFHVWGTWQLAQLLCLSAVVVVVLSPSPRRPLAFLAWQLTQLAVALPAGA
jgi:hypothetical protein